MRKLILLFMSLFMIMTGTSFANDINNGNYFLECKIGSLGLRESFDMKQLNQLFGNMSKPAYQGGPATNPLALFFNNARVVVIGNEIYIVDVKTSTGKNGEPLKTPRGISVGSNLDAVFRMYGTPYRTYKYQNQVSYSYGNYAHDLTFTVDSNNKVIGISIGEPTC